MPHPKLSESQRLEIARLYSREGKTSVELASQFKVDKATVLTALRKQGVIMRPSGHTFFMHESKKTEALTRYHRGDTMDSIAEHFGINDVTMARWFKKQGVTRPGYTKVGCPRKDGYIAVFVEKDDPMRSMTQSNGKGYTLEHRLVMAYKLGRPLEKHETVHHINGIRTDNRPENLELRSGRHGRGVVMTCRCCGSHDIACTELNKCG